MPKAVLLVDDNPIDLMINEKTLQRYKPELIIFKASGAEEALKMIQSKECEPDCILLDIKMPIMDGFEFLEALEQSSVEVNFEIHMLSSSIDPSDLRLAEESPIVKTYIEKPLAVDKLNRIAL